MATPLSNPQQSFLSHLEIEPTTDNAPPGTGAARHILSKLESHPQRVHIAEEISAARAKLDLATNRADPKSPEAKDAGAQSVQAAQAASQAADKSAEYSKKRGEADAMVKTMNGAISDEDMKKFEDELKDADEKAKPPQRDYNAASAILDGLKQKVQTQIQSWSNYVKNGIPALKAKPAKAFIASEISQIEKDDAEIQSAIGGGEWRKAVLAIVHATSLIAGAGRLADRRAAYDTEHAIAVAAISKVQAQPAVRNQVESLNKRLDHANSLADQKFNSSRIETAVAELKGIEKTCGELTAAAGDIEACLEERKAADAKLAELKQKPSSAQMSGTVSAIEKRLEIESKSIDEMLARPDMAGDWKGTRAAIKKAMDELNAASSEVERVKGVASGAKDPPSIAKAVAELRHQATEIARLPGAGLVKADLAAVEKDLKSAETLAAGGKAEAAAKDLQAAGNSLAAARAVQLQHAHFAEQHAAIESREKVLKGLPVAPAIGAKIQQIHPPLDTAAQKEKARAWPEAVAALEQAVRAAVEAERMAQERQKYDDRAKKIEEKVKADATLAQRQKEAIARDIEKSKGSAAAFKFDQAAKELDFAEAELESAVTDKLSKATPLDPAKLERSAEQVMKQGGARLLDDMVKKMPDTTDFKVVAALAKVRFGIELKSDPGDATKSAKRMWEMMAKVPQDVLGNPSLKTVERVDPNKNGGFYRNSDQLVHMNGRPGQSPQGFGKDIASELPANVDITCQPKDDKPVDYFDFATLHEVGHSVDDRNNFMNSRMGNEQFGNWKSHGGDLEPIANAVAQWAGYDETAEQKKYVLDLMLGKTPEIPPAPPEKADKWKEGRAKVVEWYAIASTQQKVWWSQTDSEKITMKDGRIYQEAYVGTWVSYSASARRQGITGYQFRAPGEWFAELYASYHSGKLKDSHPACQWLKTLST